jgi:hypothetical protein
MRDALLGAILDAMRDAIRDARVTLWATPWVLPQVILPPPALSHQYPRHFAVRAATGPSPPARPASHSEKSAVSHVIAL